MTNMIQYTDTAYTLAKKNGLKPPDPDVWRGQQRHHRALALPNGIHFGDYRWSIKTKLLRQLQGDTLTNPDLTNIYLSPGSNPLYIVMVLRIFASIFAVMGLVPGIAGIFIGSPTLSDYIFFFWGGGAFLILHLLTKIVPDKNSITMNRATGMVSLPPFYKQDGPLPFAEFDGYYRTSCSRHGVIRYTLSICHRYKPIAIITDAGETKRPILFSQWEMYQQLMDINQPLPDLPEYEPVRQLDPTTKAWDEKHKRDPNYWKNFDLRKAFDAMVDAVDKCEAFDWDSLPTDHVPPEAKARASSMAQLFKE